MAKQQSSNVFNELSSLNVNDKVEKKNGLTYLSWAYAWSEVKKVHPDANYEIKFFDGKPYVFDEKTGYMVFTEVTIQGLSHTMWLPVMDGANKAMMDEQYTYSTRYGEKSVEAATMFDINKTIMRCLVKNLAMFGLGIYIYAGEDLPENEQAQVVTSAKKTTQKKEVALSELKVGDSNWNKVIFYVEANKTLSIDKIIAQLQRKYVITEEVYSEIEKILA